MPVNTRRTAFIIVRRVGLFILNVPTAPRKHLVKLRPTGEAMPRVRSDDYETKGNAILDCAAILFAREGYPSAKMQDIAVACGATKSMLYHYYPTKDDLLFAML